MITHGAALWWLAQHAAYAKPPTPPEALIVALITPPAPLPAAPEAIEPLPAPAPEPIPVEPQPVIPEPVVRDPEPVPPEPVAVEPEPVAEPPPPPEKVKKPRKIKKPKAARIKKPVAPAPAAIQEPQPQRLPEPEIAKAEPEPAEAAAPTNVAIPAQLLRPTVVAEPVAPPMFNADYLRNPAPPYPRLSRRLGEQGKVMLRVLVNIAGNAEKIEIQASSGSTRLDQAALQAVTQWRFVPARKGAEPVTEWVVVPIVFSLEG